MRVLVDAEAFDLAERPRRKLSHQIRVPSRYQLPTARDEVDQAAERELMRLRQLKALKAAAGSWKDKDHPELKGGAAKWVAKLRSQDEKRFQKVTAR